MNTSSIHFINRIDENNAGDMSACPLQYYYDFFKDYRIIRHDISFIDFDKIHRGDVVILGGGGLINYSEALNRNINRLFDTGADVIAWSPGINTHYEYSGTFDTEIDFDRFTLVTLRDFENKYDIPFLPDVSCKYEKLQQKYDIKRQIGIACHKDYAIDGFDYDIVRNDEPIEEIIKFIGESEVVISDSYHMLYWAMLMGKKAICVSPFSTRFDGYKWKPSYFDKKKDIEDVVTQVNTYDILDECIKLNDAFFEKVKKVIKGKLKPVTDKDYMFYQLISNNAVLYQKCMKSDLRVGNTIDSELFIDIGEGFSENNKRICINNVYGDEVCEASFQLGADSHNIKLLRFDPIEGYYCNIKIIEATLNGKPVEIRPNLSICKDGWDCFLTTDPQYLIISPAYQGELSISFSIKKQGLGETQLYAFANNNHRSFIIERLIQLEKLEVEKNELDYRCNEYQQQIGVLEKKVEDYDGTVSKLSEQDKKCKEYQQQVSMLQSELNGCETIISSLREQDILNKKLNDQIMDKLELLTRANNEYSDAKHKLQSEYENVVNLNNGLLSDNERLHNELHSTIEGRDILEKRAWEADENAKKYRDELDRLYASRAWKLVLPLRKIWDYFHR